MLKGHKEIECPAKKSRFSSTEISTVEVVVERCTLSKLKNIQENTSHHVSLEFYQSLTIPGVGHHRMVLWTRAVRLFNAAKKGGKGEDGDSFFMRCLSFIFNYFLKNSCLFFSVLIEEFFFKAQSQNVIPSLRH